MMKGAKNGTSEQIAIRVPHDILARARKRRADTGQSLAGVLVEAIDFGLSEMPRAPAVPSGHNVSLRDDAPPNTPASTTEPTDQQLHAADTIRNIIQRKRT
jgi:hypothetical protein